MYILGFDCVLGISELKIPISFEKLKKIYIYINVL